MLPPFSMYWALRTVHVQDHPSVLRAGHSSVHPLSVQSAQPFHVAVLGKHLGFEPAHGVGAGGRSFRTTSPSNDYPHRRIVGQPFSVVGILVARQTTVHRRRRPTNRCCTLRPPRLPCRHSFAVSVSPSASSNSRQASSPASEVMVAPRNSNRTRRSKRSVALGVGAFTHWVPPEWVRYQDLKLSNTTSLALMITTVLCYSTTSSSSVADCGPPSRG